MPISGNAVVSAHTAPWRAVRNKLVIYGVDVPGRMHVCLTAAKELNISDEEGLWCCECHGYVKGTISLWKLLGVYSSPCCWELLVHGGCQCCGFCTEPLQES